MKTIREIYELFEKYPHISIDSRKIIKDSLFFALKGDNFNGNEFAKMALDNGAAFAIVDDEKYCISEKTILVENVLKTLQELGRFHRNKLKIPILAITGTNGKTTTKELTAAVLSKKFKVSATEGNLNNHIGVPLTLLKMNGETEFGVVEMGANHVGEIEQLCTMANPDFGLITNVGKAHLEGFGSFEGVKKAKSELYHFIQSKNGTIFISGENDDLMHLARQNEKKVTYGTRNSYFIGELIQSPPFVHVKAQFPKGVLYLHSNLTGNYNFENIMAAACIGKFFGVEPLKMQEAVKNYEPQNIRSQLIKKGNINVVMDAYNANPTSMQESIKSFVKIYPKNNFLILGDMLELGKYAKEEHINIIRLIKMNDFSEVYLVGNIFSELGKNTDLLCFENVEELTKHLTSNKIKNGNLLIKGSRGVQLEKILDVI